MGPLFQVGVLGLSHKCCDLKKREVFWHTLFSLSLPFSCVPLMTCNRLELYFSAENIAEAHTHILRQLRERQIEEIDPFLYSYFSEECFLHLARVTSGLDSAILGESEIQRQVKLSYEKAKEEKTLPSPIHYLFQKALKIGKDVRTKWNLASTSPSLEKTIFSLVEWLNEDPKEASILFVGNSQINRQVAHFFQKKGMQTPTFCSRKRSEMGIHLPREKLHSWIDYDIVICGAKEEKLLITPTELKRSALLFDLSVPRLIDPKLAHHPNVTLFNMEMLESIVQSHRKQAEDEMCLAMQYVEENSERLFKGFVRKREQMLAF